MPYIVTTRMAAEPPNQNVAVRAEVLSRTAVTTLEEARQAAIGALPEDRTRHAIERIIEDIEDLPESGGTVGPLPDGTVIEVQRVVRAAAGNDGIPF